MGADVIGVGVADAGATGADVTSVGPARAGTTRVGVEGRLGVGPLGGFARWVVARVRALRSGARDAGMATAEYAIATLATVAAGRRATTGDTQRPVRLRFSGCCPVSPG